MLPALSEALRQRDFPTAITLARQEVEQRPEDAGAHHALGMALQGAGELDAARAAYEKAIELAPDRAVPQMSLAHLDMSQQRLEAAEATIQSALEADPNHLEAYVALVHLALARGDNELAAKHLKYAQRVDEDHPDVLVAEGHVHQFAGRSEKALSCFFQAVQLQPTHGLGQCALGMAYLRQGNFAFAEQALRNARSLQPGNFGVLRALVQALIKQEKGPELLEVLDDLLMRHPQQHGMRMMRADLRVRAGDFEGALQDRQQLAEVDPIHPANLLALTRLLLARGDVSQAIAYAEKALAAKSDIDLNWNTRISLSNDDLLQTTDVLRRWREAMPQSRPAMEAYAQLLEQKGEFTDAEEWADRILSQSEGAVVSQFIKMRAELRREPTAALHRLRRLEASAKAPEALRMVHSWKGYAYYLLGDFEASGASFRAMLQYSVPSHHLPKLFDAQTTPPDGASGTILWSPCGLRMEPVLHALAPVLGRRLMAERNTEAARQDGFGHWRMVPGSVDADGQVVGSAASWRAALRARGVDASRIVDWQPHWDAYTASELKGARLLALMMDPRDALLNWIVYGSAQGYLMYPRTEINASWLAAVYSAVADTLESEPDRVTICVMDDMGQDAATIAAQLQTALQTDEMPSAEILGAPIIALGGVQTRFPAGTWRRYRATFGAEFDLLTPVAQRLGYPAE